MVIMPSTRNKPRARDKTITTTRAIHVGGEPLGAGEVVQVTAGEAALLIGINAAVEGDKSPPKKKVARSKPVVSAER